LKNIIFVSFILLSTNIYADGNTSLWNVKAPSLKNGCSSTNESFTLYKGTRCTGGFTHILRPRCIEYSLKKNLGMDVSEAKHYNHKEAIAYLRKQAD